MTTFRQGGITFALGYSTSGPVAIPLDSSSSLPAHPPGGYGLFLGATPALRAPQGAYGAFGTPEQEAAGAWAAGATTGSGVWTGVAVGLAVWAITKLLDRMIFHEKR